MRRIGMFSESKKSTTIPEVVLCFEPPGGREEVNPTTDSGVVEFRFGNATSLQYFTAANAVSASTSANVYRVSRYWADVRFSLLDEYLTSSRWNRWQRRGKGSIDHFKWPTMSMCVWAVAYSTTGLRSRRHERQLHVKVAIFTLSLGRLGLGATVIPDVRVGELGEDRCLWHR